MMRSYIKLADRLSISMGKAFSWCIVILMGGTCYEVFMAYALNAPTLWNFDFSLKMYGAIFMMAGAYTLSTEAHVRGDVIYRLFSQKTYAKRVMKYLLMNQPNYKLAYENEFGPIGKVNL